LREANAATHIEQIQVYKIVLSYQASQVSKKDFSTVLYTGRQYIGRVPLNFFGNVDSYVGPNHSALSYQEREYKNRQQPLKAESGS